MMENLIYYDEIIRAEFEPSEIPWVKIFAQGEFCELSDMSKNSREYLFLCAMITEEAMREFYAPKKINHASFANYVPRVHLHIQARFSDDSFFPESMWGKIQRKGAVRELNLAKFKDILRDKFSKFHDEFWLNLK